MEDIYYWRPESSLTVRVGEPVRVGTGSQLNEEVLV